jgi:energy-coupling factor transporter ATP-binding protein EcfA2
MWFNNLNLRGVIVESTTSETEYIYLPDQSASLVGPNGVGKSSFVSALQGAFTGVAEENNHPFHLQLDFLIPADLENWCETNGDFGVVRSVYNIVTDDAKNIQRGEDFTPSNNKFQDSLTLLLEKSVLLAYKEWHDKLVNLPDSELVAYENVEPEYRTKALQDLLDFVARMILERPTDIEQQIGTVNLKIEEAKEINDKFLARTKSIAQKLSDAENQKSFVLTPVGVQEKPEWKIDYVFRLPISELEGDLELWDFASTFVLPKSIKEAKQHRGYFGFAKTDPNESEIQRSYVRFIDDEIWFGLHLGFTNINTGIKLLNPDEISLDDLKRDISELINLPLTFSENPIEVGFWHTAQIANSDWKFRKYGIFNGQGFAPFGNDHEFTDAFVEYLKEISASISGFFNGFLPGSPSVQISTNRKELWVTKGLLNFETRDGYLVKNLDELSDTQQRWLKVSICLAIYAPFNLAIFVDEPERGIQRVIEPSLLDHLELVQSESQIPWIFASHSAEVISRGNTTIQIRKDREGMRSVRRISGSLYPKLGEIGLSEEEYFQSIKLIVLTEGVIDKAMLDGFALEKFRERNIEIVSGYGLNSWNSFFDSNYYRKTSGVKTLFISDSLDTQKLSELISEAKIRNEPQGLNYFFRTNLPSCVNETWSSTQNHIVATIIAESFRSNFSKVSLDSTGDWDCLMWISPESLGFDVDTTWDQLVHEFDSEPRGNSNASRGERFKSFLKLRLKRKGIKQPLDALRLQNLCSEMAVTGQSPEKVGLLIDRIINFS